MLKGEDFPDYPFMDQETESLQTGMTTYFGKNHHEKLLTHDSGQFLISYGGPDTTINIFNTETETLVGVAEVPSGEGGQVTAATFSNDGNLFYAAVDLNGTDSILSRGRFKDGEIKWETSAVLCNVRVADLHFDPSVDSSILMVGFYEGLYVLSLEKVFGAEKVVPAPTYTFNALGHVAYDFFARTLYATSSTSDSATPDRYNSIAVVNLSEAFANAEGSPEKAAEFSLMDVQGQLLYGDDDIAVSQANDDGQNQLYVVVDNPNSGKSLLSYVSPNPGRDVVVTDRYNGLPDTEIRLAYHNNAQVLILALEDHCCLQVFSGGKLMTERVPVQLLPSDVAVEQNKGMVYALNYAGNTVSVIPPSELDVSSDFNSDLKNYRLQVIMAFVALFGNLLQNLKDCFCHLLLVQCPSCTDNEKVWLASITIKENEVFKICNIGKRKEVLTFPKFEYWLSIIPILPILKTGFSKVCCAIFPNIFGNLLDKYRTTEDEREYSLVRGRTYKQAVRTSKRTDTAVLLRENTQTVGLMSKLVTDRVLYQQQAASSENVALSKQQYRNMQTTEAVQQMEQQGVQVKVEEYREAQAGRILQKYQQTPKNIPKDSEVTVYQKNGKVLFYAVEKSAPATAEISDAQLNELEVRKQALQDMQEINESLARVESRKQAVVEMAEVQNQLTKLQEEKNKAQEEVAVLNEQLVALKGEREKTVTDMKELQDGVAQLNSNLQIMKVEITKERSVKEISSVDSDSQLLLKEEGIVTINDLANTDSATLEARGIEKEKATLMVNEAKSKISLLP